jgi:hypothetical protein
VLQEARELFLAVEHDGLERARCCSGH